MSVEEILEVIEAIPKFIKYVYPGYLTIYTYLFLRGKTMKDSSSVIVKAIALSYFYILIINAAAEVIDLSFVKVSRELKENIGLLMVSIIFAFVCYWGVTHKQTRGILEKINIHTTFYDNEIEMLANFNEGAWLCVYLNNDEIVYEGSLGEKELDEEKRKYITLDAFYKYYLDNNGKPKEPYVEDHEGEYEETVLIFYDDIKRIEKRN